MKIAGLLLAVLMAVMAPIAHADPASIVPGKSIAGIELGTGASEVLPRLGKPDFYLKNEDGSEVAEYGLLSSDNPPDARLWVMVDQGKVVRVGTDGPAREFLTAEGLGVGNTLREFVDAYGKPVKVPEPGVLTFSNGLSIGLNRDLTVHSVWIDADDAPVS